MNYFSCNRFYPSFAFFLYAVFVPVIHAEESLLPSNPTWYFASASQVTPGNVKSQPGELIWTLDDPPGNSMIWTYFPKNSLSQVGDSLTLTFMIASMDFGHTSYFRVGFFHSGGNQVAYSLSQLGNESFGNYRGISVWSDGLVSPKTKTSVHYRTGGNDVLWAGEASPVIDPPQSGMQLTTMFPVNGSLTLTKSANGIDISFQLGACSFTATDVSQSVEDFDTLSFFSGPTTTVDTLTLSNLSLVFRPGFGSALEVIDKS